MLYIEYEEKETMSIDEIKAMLEENLTPKRFIHSLNVMNTAMDLATRYGTDIDKCAVAGLLHDCARDIKGKKLFGLCERYDIHIDKVSRIQPELLHGALGSVIAKKEYGILDKHILKAICFHTTGREDMTLIDKILFIADHIEPNRSYRGVNEVRDIAYDNLDKAILLSLEKTIMYVISKGALINTLTVKARNYIILQQESF